VSKKDLAASIRQRLLNLAKERSEDFNFILTQYAIQRVLYRLSIPTYRDQFLLKGAWLFSVWSKEPHRPTRDADFLGFGDNNVEHLLTTFKQICNLAVEDGLTFDMDSFEAVTIKENAIYQGVRITGYAELAKARIAIQLDVAFGDVVIPGAQQAVIPVYLDLPAPELKVYPVYSVIAEKYQAMAVLGMANSRMKDFYDIWRIAQLMQLDGSILLQAIMATFEQRETELTDQLPFVLSDEFRLDAGKQKQWKAFLQKSHLIIEIDFVVLLEQLGVFLEPVYRAAAGHATWEKQWSPKQWQWLG